MAEIVFNLSVALLSMLLLVATLLVEEDKSRVRAVVALRIYLAANIISWLAFTYPTPAAQWLSWSMAALSYCSMNVFCTRRAGLDSGFGFPATVFAITSLGFAWAVAAGSQTRVMFTAAILVVTTLAPALHSILVRKSARTRSDVLLAASLVGFVGWVALRSTVWFVAPESAVVVGQAQFLLIPSLHLAFGLFGVTGYMEEANERLRTQAMRDALTGIWNRQGFTTLASAHFSRAARAGLPMTVVSIDIDHFKSINDRFGHAVGDVAIRTMAQLLSSTAREGDLPTRWGGEEFMVLLPYASERDGFCLATRIRDKLHAATGAGPADAPHFTVSIGIASSTGQVEPDALYAAADRALYLAKNNGRDRIEFAEATAGGSPSNAGAAEYDSPRVH